MRDNTLNAPDLQRISEAGAAFLENAYLHFSLLYNQEILQQKRGK
jgi:hypothetical protein